jgi:hypothetical protein
MKETIEARKHFFNLSEASEAVGKRKMIHSTEINRIKNGKSLHNDEGLIELDMKISIKMDELNALLEERKNYGKMSKEDFLEQMKKFQIGK